MLDWLLSREWLGFLFGGMCIGAVFATLTIVGFMGYQKLPFGSACDKCVPDYKERK